MSDIEIPRSREDVSAQWLEAMLRQAGLLSVGRVKSARTSPVGDGRGFLGHLYRVELDVEGAQRELPASVIVKLPTTSKVMRGVGTTLGVFEREVRFYRELAADLPIRTPRSHFAEMDVPASEHELAKFARANRLPRALMRPWITLQMLRAGVGRGRRYALVLEDLGHAEIGDQIGGCGADVARRVLHDAARLHAHHWNERGLDSMPWLRPLGESARLFVQSARGGRNKLRTFFPTCGDALDAYMQWASDHGEALLEQLDHGPRTLLHGDLRLDNVFFEDEEVIVADWQGVLRATGAIDVAYFIAQSVREDVPEAEVNALLEGYHGTLVEHGVAGYGLGDLVRDYQRGLLFTVIWLSSFAGTTDLTRNPQLHRLLGRVAERLVHRLQVVKLDRLLAA